MFRGQPLHHCSQTIHWFTDKGHFKCKIPLPMGYIYCGKNLKITIYHRDGSMHSKISNSSQTQTHTMSLFVGTSVIT